jgi:hypothetical protein
MHNTENVTVKRVAIAQGVYYIAAAIWPVVSMSSFWRVFGPEYSWWLVLTMSFLIFCIGCSVLVCLMIKNGLREVGLLGLSVAIMLIAADMWFVATGAISPLYLLDVVVQGLIIFGWMITFDWRSVMEAWKK